MESDAGGMVRRRALKTRSCESGWGSTPPLSAKQCWVWHDATKGIDHPEVNVVRYHARRQIIMNILERKKFWRMQTISAHQQLKEK